MIVTAENDLDIEAIRKIDCSCKGIFCFAAVRSEVVLVNDLSIFNSHNGQPYNVELFVSAANAASAAGCWAREEVTHEKERTQGRSRTRNRRSMGALKTWKG